MREISAIMVGIFNFDEDREIWKGFVKTAEFYDFNKDKINDNRCLDLVHRNAVMKWTGGNRN